MAETNKNNVQKVSMQVKTDRAANGIFKIFKKYGPLPRVLLTHPGGGGLIQGPTHPEFWHTHRPTNVPPPHLGRAKSKERRVRAGGDGDEAPLRAKVRRFDCVLPVFYTQQTWKTSIFHKSPRRGC